MSIPDQINDGNWRDPFISKVDISYPFSDQGDVISFEASCAILQDKVSYRTPNLGDQITIPGMNGAFRGYLVDPGQPSDAGNGLFSFMRVYASIPATRREPTTTAITVPIGLLAGSLINFTYTFAGYVEYEYALQPFQPLIALKVFQIGNITYVIRGDDQSTIGIPSAGPMLSDDSEVGIYKGSIYFRRSVYAEIPPTGFFS